MMQPVARRHAKIPDAGCGIEDQELAEGGTLHVNRKPLHAISPEELLRATIGEARNHASQ